MTLRLESDKNTQVSDNQGRCGDNIVLDSIFQDNLILQRGVSNAVSGHGAPWSRLRLSFNQVTVHALSSRDGRFTFRLPPMEAVSGDSLTITDEKNGSQLKLENVAVGDVYIIAGQSNMSFTLRDSRPGMDTLSDADFQGIRYFKIQDSSFYGPQTCFGGKWAVASRESSSEFSGVGFFFASKLVKLNGVPVGIVDSSLGGLNIESWISRGTLLTLPHYRNELLEYEKKCSTAAACAEAAEDTGLPSFERKFTDGLKQLFPTLPQDEGESLGYHLADFDDSQWDTMKIPDNWTQAGHNHAGYFWFRYDITLPEDAAQREWDLNLGMIDKADRTFFNGTLVGTTGVADDMATWNTPRSYKIPRGVARAGRNVIAVLVSSVLSICEDGGLMGTAEMMNISSGSDCLSLGGIWRLKETYDAGTEGMTFMMKLGYGAPQSFSMYYDNMIKPLSGFQFSGAIWYQGEANAICRASIYREALVAMIADWRRAFENADMPFYIIQLPDFGNPHLLAPFSQWALLREAQVLAAKETGSRFLVTLGSGDVVDIHPKNKKAVGDEIAEMEFGRQQDRPVPDGPRPVGGRSQDGALLLDFACAAPLAVLDGENNAPLGGFAIAGADGVAYAADCEICGDSALRLSSPLVREPKMVWYAWADNPLPFANLGDKDGRRAAPFRFCLDGNPHDAVTSIVLG